MCFYTYLLNMCYMCCYTYFNLCAERYSICIICVFTHTSSAWAQDICRELLVCQKRPTCMPKETYLHDKRDLPVCQKRATCMPKETYLYTKRDLLVCPKRPTCMPKESYLHARRTYAESYVCAKRDLLVCQKRPAFMTKETYLHEHRTYDESPLGFTTVFTTVFTTATYLHEQDVWREFPGLRISRPHPRAQPHPASLWTASYLPLPCRTGVYVCVRMYMYMRVCVYACVRVCVYACMYVCVYVRMCVCVWMRARAKRLHCRRSKSCVLIVKTVFFVAVGTGQFLDDSPHNVIGL